jgi:hypothetical protein
LPRYRLAFPALFFTTGFAGRGEEFLDGEAFDDEALGGNALCGRDLDVKDLDGNDLDGEALAVAVTGARGLLADLAEDVFAAAFLGGSGAFPLAPVLAGFATVFLPPRFGLPPPLATRSSISAMASASVMVSCVLSLGIVALTPPEVT